jgi:succinylarginine dihydrolase
MDPTVEHLHLLPAEAEEFAAAKPGAECDEGDRAREPRSSSSASRSSSMYAASNAAISASVSTVISGCSNFGFSTIANGFVRMSRHRTACLNITLASIKWLRIVFGDSPRFAFAAMYRSTIYGRCSSSASV